MGNEEELRQCLGMGNGSEEK